MPIGLVMLGVCSATMIIRPIQYAGLGYVLAGALVADIAAEYQGLIEADWEANVLRK